MKRKYNYEGVLKTVKPIDAWWCVLFTDPLTLRPTLFLANHTSIKPNHITVSSILLNIFSAICFFQGTNLFLILGATLFELSFLLDTIDGKLARLTNSESEFGKKLDWLGGCLYSNLTLVALILSQGILKDDVNLFLLGVIYLVLNDVLHFGFLNAPPLPESLEIITQKGYVKSKLLTYLIAKYYLLKKSFMKLRLAYFPTEIDCLNIILFLSPLFGFIFWGILLGLLITSVRFVMVILIICDRKMSKSS